MDAPCQEFYAINPGLSMDDSHQTEPASQAVFCFELERLAALNCSSVVVLIKLSGCYHAYFNVAIQISPSAWLLVK